MAVSPPSPQVMNNIHQGPRPSTVSNTSQRTSIMPVRTGRLMNLSLRIYHFHRTSISSKFASEFCIVVLNYLFQNSVPWRFNCKHIQYCNSELMYCHYFEQVNALILSTETFMQINSIQQHAYLMFLLLSLNDFYTNHLSTEFTL